MSEEAKSDQELLLSAIKGLHLGMLILLPAHAIVRMRDGAWIMARLTCEEPLLQVVFDAEEACLYAEKWGIHGPRHLLRPKVLPPMTNDLEQLKRVLKS